ncbi:hypothetical protein Z517_09296 [Fonsecaea pedrosoi CBS 271.37]|uniref:Unplaced genomic scaffold supercont1.6, whole genome shotgun sequence n=1 Tax=Fonsecaea pedrosoi CBS 271.37 TaxID=1442368 RepID=A0A0D2ERG9_9EURO|nr:uncharacterized protein Z517_09296 [Fonsecaea pedrosoi CBS 271.37]KIW76852.1 hypothetical protein Z517_09296 [Fonsecaea pedrosoi CBS 271.37]
MSLPEICLQFPSGAPRHYLGALMNFKSRRGTSTTASSCKPRASRIWYIKSWFRCSNARTEDNLKFEFRICPAWASKPATADATNNAAFEQLPKYEPGSDVVDADPALIVTKVHGTHLLVLNRFAVFRPQYLILTLDLFRTHGQLTDCFSPTKCRYRAQIADLAGFDETSPIKKENFLQIYQKASQGGLSPENIKDG